MPKARVPAFAKINLTLEVLWKRADNYHDIASVFQTIDLCDWLTIEVQPASSTHITVASNVPIPGQNIAERASHAVLETLQRSAEIHIYIEKRIPLGGGLGGSSTDGSAILLALPRLLNLPLPLSEMERIGASLGSDVNFFLHGGRGSTFGRGEVVQPMIDGEQYLGILRAPGFASDSGEAYRSLNRSIVPEEAQLPARARHHALLQRMESEPLAAWAGACKNDFEAAIFARHPNLSEILHELALSGAPLVRMSGSGSSLFALYSGDRPDIEGIPFRTLSRADYERAWRQALNG